MLLRCKFLITLSSILLNSFFSFGQERFKYSNYSKPPIDTSCFRNWPSISQTGADKTGITNNGEYIFYNVYPGNGLVKLVIQSIQSGWKTEVIGARNATFTNCDSKVIYQNSGDSLCIRELGSNKVSYFPGIRSFGLIKMKGGDRLIYHTLTNALAILPLNSGKKHVFTNVESYLISKKQNILLLKAGKVDDKNGGQSLVWINLDKSYVDTIWKGKAVEDLTMDDEGRQLAFIVPDSGLQTKNCWHYRENEDKAHEIVGNYLPGIASNLQFDGISEFTADGSNLFISLRERVGPQPDPNLPKVNIWSYLDRKLQSQQQGNFGGNRYLAVMNLTDQSIARVQYENEFVSLKSNSEICFSNISEISQEKHWNHSGERSLYLRSLNYPKQSRIKIDTIATYEQFSPDNKYIIGFDNDRKDLFSYEIATRITRNLTSSLPHLPADLIERDGFDRPIYLKDHGLLVIGWSTDYFILIADEFDIWLVDLSNKKKPTNLTNGFGRKHKIIFRLSQFNKEQRIAKGQRIVLTAFNKINKNSGFYSIKVGKSADPELLHMGPELFDPGYVKNVFQLKALNAEVYIVRQEKCTQSPDFFWTRDFKSFVPLTSICPEKKYNWLTSELMDFTTLDGRTEQGILYKPENFDSTKKYPVILHYYERKSQDLNRYQKPGGNGTGGDLDIAWFVSHGYLVFEPDIHYLTGEPGEGAYNSISAAAEYLSQLPWVNGKKIGIQGHSFGGYETNYVLTRTSQFAAAVSTSGPSDFISFYGSFSQYFSEVWQLRIGTTLWVRPDLYIKNSPVLYANKVTTPVLITANKGDRNVPFEQGLEWFTALRRLGKRAWMLQYDNGGHGVGGKDFIDYVLRMTQFFDHYLKDSTAPVWMTRGIPASQKGLTLGYEKDTIIKTPPVGGLLNEEEKQKLDAMKHRKPITITFE